MNEIYPTGEASSSAKASLDVSIVVLAHNEERDIADCIASLPTPRGDLAVTVVVNGSSDATAQIVADHADLGVRLVEYKQGGKSRSWNRFMLDEAEPSGTYVLVDGDARITPGTIDGLLRCLAENPRANAASAMPCNGRRVAEYRRAMMEEHGLFGDCYALRGSFVARMRSGGIRLPSDLIGDDSLVGALVKTDLGTEADWDDERVVVCPDAGFLCRPNSFGREGMRMQAGRMINYSVRHFQNRMVSAIMQRDGPGGLPERMADIYPEWLPRLRPRFNPIWFAFDRRALARMRAAAGS